METIINDKKYSTETSTKLLERGIDQAQDYRDGRLCLYRSAKGNFWGSYAWWSNPFGAQNFQWFDDVETAKKLVRLKCDPKEYESIFGAVEVG